MSSILGRGTSLYELLYGEDEGTIRLEKGTVTYSYDDDQFRVRDNTGKRVYQLDLGEAVERWLVENGWLS